MQFSSKAVYASGRKSAEWSVSLLLAPTSDVVHFFSLLLGTGDGVVASAEVVAGSRKGSDPDGEAWLVEADGVKGTPEIFK